MHNILEVNNLNKKYGDFKLENINFNLLEGKILGFIGENGSGKTTTIKSILNLIKIDSGTINIFDLKHDKLSRDLREQIGVVLDDGFLPEQLNYDDIRIIMSKLYTKWDNELFIKYVRQFKLPKNKTMKEYSSGMKMKLKLIAALCHHPKLLILDEPTSGLDPVARYDVLDILKEFMKDRKHAILISSHITTDLENIADDIIFIDNGKIVLKENKNILLDDYGIIRLKEQEINKIAKTDYIKYLTYKDINLILINNKEQFNKKYPTYTIERPTLENIMLVYMRGVKNE